MVTLLTPEQREVRMQELRKERDAYDMRSTIAGAIFVVFCILLIVGFAVNFPRWLIILFGCVSAVGFAGTLYYAKKLEKYSRLDN